MKSANWFRLAVVPLLAYAMLFAVLAVDVVARLVAGAGHQETGNLVLLLFFESLRAVRVLVGLTLVVLLLVRSVHREDARALALFLLFGVVSYAIAFGGGGYVGPFQHWLTGALRGAGFSRQQLYIAFGYAAWPAWLALGGLIRFAMLFPTPLAVESVEHSGGRDRAGMMRSVPGAGIDVGALFRKTTSSAMRAGALRPLPVWSAVIAGAVLSILLNASRWRSLLWVPYLAGVAIAITFFRASYDAGDADTRHRLRWIGRGGFAALGLLVAAGVAGLRSGPAGAVAVFVLLTLAPGALLLGLGLAVLQRRRSENVAPEGS